MVVVISANISGGHVNPAVTFGLFVVPAFGLSGISIWSAFVFEIVATFGLVYKVYATAIDPKKGEIEIITPLAFGLIIGANILAAGPFTRATMNPTVVFGPTVVSFTWANHWIYWAGPLISGRLTGLMYEIFFISHTYEPSSGF